MLLRDWCKLPENMKTDEVRFYYDILKKRRLSLIVKRLFDFFVALILLILLSPTFLALSLLIVVDSKGNVFYRQERITTNGKKFKIHKFRTMVSNADKIGTSVTVNNDTRITKVGFFLRKYRMDEIPQLIDVLSGNMSFVGTRPEVTKYVMKYTPEMMATLLLPAGITSRASIMYKDEDKLLNSATDVDKVYTEKVLPKKMKYNLDSIKSFSFFNDIKTMFETVFAVLGINYNK